ncbi:hypothetical protein [Actinotalea sp. C106]|uniref:hypothetical protein n=1 Tax=Actinotalea sp. C106 TaxID=2908644 RepID=UPI002028DB73|nr:hypothetical protein [Actinotalea sp. C106]
MTLTELNLEDAHGVWAVRSDADVVYVVDTERQLLLRQPGPTGRSIGGWDGCWVPLTRVVSEPTGEGLLTVGARTRWTVDPEPGEARSWTQRACTSIDPVSADAVPAGRTPDPDERWRSPSDLKWDAVRADDD